MKNTELNGYAGQYKDELLNNVIPFWLEHSKDSEYGGYYSCLDRFGNVFDTDKFIWLQGREVWMFSMLYNEMENRQEWLEMAIHGAEFLKQHGRDEKGDWYFSLDRQGNPLVQPYNIFSDCFAAMAFGELYKATKNEEYKKIAVDTYNNIIKRKDNPKGPYNKLYPGTRPLKSFALPMILCNLSLILEDVMGSQKIDEIVPSLIDDIMINFYQKDTGVILENIHPDGSVVDCFEGRLVNPGHTNESMWFLMDLGVRYNDQKLIDKAVEILLHSIEFGWDKEHGGIFYFMDVKGHPQQQLEWDQKLWWVHLETLIALAKGYKLTGNQECKKWFEIMQTYTWDHFKDKEYREWYGYLTRQGQPLLPLKGGKWKGCFHVPRAMFQLYKILSQE
ncbi:MAG: AGE family epimerase/isomerase [Bacteroidota bacterium]|nr:AGE family epimerase/isomerase [Bacteroidota bacterium]